MRHFALAAVVAIGLVLAGCGSGNSKPNINGTWNATLTGSNNSPAFGFSTTLQQNSNGTVTVSNFKFTSISPCFSSGNTETGSFTLSGTFSGQVNSKFGLTIQSGTPMGDTLAMIGTVKGNTISGNWTLTGGSGCTGSGTFTMTKA